MLMTFKNFVFLFIAYTFPCAKIGFIKFKKIIKIKNRLFKLNFYIDSDNYNILQNYFIFLKNNKRYSEF